MILIGIALSLTASASVAWACRCREPPTRTAYRTASLVVEGTVLEVKPRPDIDGAEISFEVAGAWKGDAPAVVSFTTGTDCAYPVKSGERHLLFLTRTPAGDLTTGRCRGSGGLPAQAAARRWLQRNGRKGRVAGAR